MKKLGVHGDFVVKRPKQITSQELKDDLLAFIKRKFYEGDSREFSQDYSRLLKWVVLWPAKWLNERGVTLPGERYKKILTDILMTSLQQRMTSKIRYRPAYLMQVVQSHFAVHGEEYYNEAKSARSLAENALLVVGRAVGAQQPDPVKELATAHALLARSKPKRLTAVKKVINLELNLS